LAGQIYLLLGPLLKIPLITGNVLASDRRADHLQLTASAPHLKTEVHEQLPYRQIAN
jgi:hypothetical protein